ncbi:MAG TPA: penicillin-binding protein 2 [Syntrophomonadaceae bacterium]|nr:penicillin-binding protein 2 [Syntrophomonadaceae bacterium]
MNRRIYIIILTFFCIFTGLAANIFYLQIVKGEKLAREATAMRDKQIELSEYPRGDILDRNLLALTGTSASNAVYCLPGVIGNEYKSSGGSNVEARQKYFKQTARFLADVVPDQTSTQIYSILVQAAEHNIPFLRMKSGLDDLQIERINSSGISGIVVAPIIKRYEESGFCAHLLGYVNTSNEGQAGLEKMYNDILSRKESSHQLVSVLDARGMVIQGLMFRLKNEQQNNRGAVVLTIDKRVQQIVEQAMNKRVKKGAVVVLNIKSREIIAMASRPTFNPYQVDQLINMDGQSNLMNRALTPYYPGSLFKIVTAAAALEEKRVDLNEKFICNGKYVFNDQVSIPCWKEEGHGELTFREALALSCNPTFITVAQRLGRDKILEYARRFHVTDESLAGYNSSPWGSYVRIDRGAPALGNACLGQKGIMLTPLQVTSLLATIADNGRWMEPSLVRYILNTKGEKVYPSQKDTQQAVSLKTAKQVQELLKLTVSKGTGKTAALQEVQVAGKTATSETGSIKENEEPVFNTWFGGYFPADKPEWAIVVLSEDGVSGSQNAAPVFKDIARGILQCYPD